MSGERVTLAYRELSEVPKQILQYSKKVRELDLSNNQFADLYFLRNFPRLFSLVLDCNRITAHTKLPRMPHLRTLCVNSNDIDNLALFMDKLVQSCHHLRYLSMLKNQACPNFFNGGTPSQYADYRLYVISRLPYLTFLDDCQVTDEERQEAVRMYSSLKTSSTSTRRQHKSRRKSPKEKSSAAVGARAGSQKQDDDGSSSDWSDTALDSDFWTDDSDEGPP